MTSQSLVWPLALASLLSCCLSSLTHGSQSFGTVICPDRLTSCAAQTSTCCPSLSNKYLCCPYANAVCCENGLHCCPACFRCNEKGNSCVREATTAAVVRIATLGPSTRPPPTKPPAPLIKPAAPLKRSEDKKSDDVPESRGFMFGMFSAVKSKFFATDQPSAAEDSSSTQGDTKQSQAQPSQQQASQLKAAQLTNQRRDKIISSQGQTSAINLKQQQQQQMLAVAQKNKLLAVQVKGRGSLPTVTKGHGSLSAQTKAAQVKGHGSAKAGPAGSQGVVTQIKQDAGSTGFFSSVLSAVTDQFYSSTEKKQEPSATVQPKQQTKQVHSQAHKQAHSQANKQAHTQAHTQTHKPAVPAKVVMSPRQAVTQAPVQAVKKAPLHSVKQAVGSNPAPAAIRQAQRPAVPEPPAHRAPIHRVPPVQRAPPIQRSPQHYTPPATQPSRSTAAKFSPKSVVGQPKAAAFKRSFVQQPIVPRVVLLAQAKLKPNLKPSRKL